VLFELDNVIYKNILKIPSLKIEKEIVTCIVGESGAGKSTLLKLLNKMILPEQGEILYKDKLLSELDAVIHRRQVVTLSQNPLIFSGNINDNLQKGLIFSHREQATTGQLNAALRHVYLNKELTDNALQLSGGEKQRLALARVLLMGPDVYLLDEPTSALDDKTEINVMESFLEEAKKRGASIVMITHSKKIAKAFGDEILTINKWTEENEGNLR
jgi:putative ABC transport system ATP-binding protein